MLANEIVTISIGHIHLYSTLADESIDLVPIIMELNIYEDIFSNVMHGNIVISDSTIIGNKQSWCGEEYIIIEFKKQENDGNEATFQRSFKVFTQSNRDVAHETNETYTLEFCSEEFLLSRKIRISKTYKDKRISEIVKDIAINYLKIDSNDFPDSHIEETLGTYNITIPNLHPFQAINWLSNLAISNSLPGNKQSGASYFFWQNRDGFFFKSILNIFNDQSNVYNGYGNMTGYSNKQFKYWTGVKNIDFNENIGEKDGIYYSIFNQILYYKNEESFNTMKAIQSGMFANKSIGIDYISRKVSKNSFDYSKYFGDSSSSGYLKKNIDLYKNQGKFPIMSEVKDRFDKKINQYDDSVIRVFLTTTGQNENNYVKKNESDIKDYNAEFSVPYRFTQIALLSHNKFSLTVPGDPGISVGKVIYVSIPQMYVGQDNKIKEEDKFLSGYYLITALRHIINMNNEYYTALEVRKDAYYDTDTNSKFGGNGLPPPTLNTPDRAKIFGRTGNISKSSSTQS